MHSDKRSRWLLWVSLLLIVGGALFLLVARPGVERPWARQHTSIPADLTPEPLVPTRTPTKATEMGRATPISSAAVSATGDASALSPTAILTTDDDSASTGEQWRGRPRWGIGVSIGPISRYNVESLRLGWYLSWRWQPNPARPGDAEFAQMVSTRNGVLRPDGATIALIAQANPGSMWLVGNEPDVKWQDNAEPAAYARLYHEAYARIKEADPTAEVAIGGVTQPTPLRLRYLEAVLAAYLEEFGAEVPVDVWNVHNFILREERDSWGVDIPPGLPDEYGTLYEIDDSDDMDIFEQQIVDFRRWMAGRGYQDRPLIVSEYGILMPEDYGFPPQRVVAFLASTFDFFQTASDPALGYPADGHRLVQRWCWYSLDAPDHIYPTGRLFDPQTGEMTAVAKGWAEYVARY